MSKAKRYNTSKRQVLSNTANSAPSVFDEANYEFNQITEQSEFDKIYNGKSSYLNQVSITPKVGL